MKRLIFCVGATLVLADAAQAARPVKTVQASPPVEFLFEARGIYPLVAAPGRISDIALEPGEALVGGNPIAAGDTARWVIGDTTSGEGATRRVHILVKPTAGDLSTNLVIYTTRRAYFLELRASERAFLTQVSWRYPQTPTVPPPQPAPAVAPLVEPAIPRVMHYGYRLQGRAKFRPDRVWDDGARTYIDLGRATRLTDLPPLFLIGPDGKAAELVNYRVDNRTLVVDRLFDRAELRLGQGRSAQRVRIERTPDTPGAVR